MKRIDFEWDNNKNLINRKKHGVDFSEALTVFYDYQAIVIEDPEHSISEERFTILGFSNTGNLLVVCYCYRRNDEVIRIISSRKASKTESWQYFIMNGGS